MGGFRQDQVLSFGNNPLTYLKTATLGSIELRWVDQLAGFEFNIVHRNGNANASADVLSRRGTMGDLREHFRVSQPLVLSPEIRNNYAVRVLSESTGLEEEPTASSLTHPS